MSAPTSKRQKVWEKLQSVGLSQKAGEGGIPQPPPRPVLGNIPDLDPAIPVQSLMKLADELGPIFRLQFPGKSMTVISSHALVDEISDTGRFEKLVHGPLVEIRDLAGDALFTAHNDEPNWGKAHRILMPAFSPVTVRGYFDAMVDVADQMLTKWARLGADAVLDVPDNMTRLTLDTIALCGFDYRFNSFYQHEMHPFVDAMVRALAEAGARSRRLPLQTRLMVLTRRQYVEDIRYMNEIVDQVIAERRLMPAVERPKDLLGLMLEGRDPQTGEGLDDVNIRQQIVTFLIAGHETTSGLLSFAVHLLLEHPEVLARARAEADEVLGDDAPRFEHMAKLGYIDQVLRETLRLWPTAPAYGLCPLEDTVIGGKYAVEAGEELLVLLPQLHRDREVWGDDVERFDPERFAPERIDRIPANAWKPFGHGQRACIGRPFAMQEATLVLAMMLRRFHISGVDPYKLDVKETLTLKPEGLQIRVKSRMKLRQITVPQHFAVAPGALVSASSEGVRAVSGVNQHATPLLVLFGSNTGSAGAFAQRIADDAAARGWACEVAALDEYVGRLPSDGAVVVVTASYNGFAPDNAVKFCDWLDGLGEDALGGVRFAVFGCGDRDWAATYQAIPRRIDGGLARAGALPLLERGESDARGDFFGDFEDWYQTVWPTLDAVFDVHSELVEDAGPRYQLERLEFAGDPLVQIHNTRAARVLANRELVAMGSPFGRSKRHLEIELPAGLTYKVGDYVMILPENDPERVARACAHFGFGADEFVRLSRAVQQSGASVLPVEQPVCVGELLGRYVDLGQAATRRDITRMLAKTACPPEKKSLERLASDSEAYRTEILEKRVSLLALLVENPSCTLEFAEFLEMLTPMRPRQYSISSSPKHDPTRCTLTVSVLDAEAWSGEGRYRGAGSCFLADLEPGARLNVALRSPNHAFYPPADPEVPLILIGAGSGIAPFRSFIQDRACQKADGEVGPVLLFFGCDHPDVDFLYREELEAWGAEGVVETYPAFSQKPAGHDEEIYFVQHRLWAERARVVALLGQGACVFVCGDGSKMAPAVRETLVRIYEQDAKCTASEAEAWFALLVERQRYLKDVY